MENFVVKIGENLLDGKFNPEFPNQVIINNKIFEIDRLKNLSSTVSAFLINNKVLETQIQRNSESELRILHRNYSYQVEIQTETSKILSKFMKTKSGGGKENIIQSPMPGLVVKVNCEIGEKVVKGQKIVTIEAMKMENALSAPRDGLIKSIKATAGQAVEKGFILVELETEEKSNA